MLIIWLIEKISFTIKRQCFMSQGHSGHIVLPAFDWLLRDMPWDSHISNFLSYFSVWFFFMMIFVPFYEAWKSFGWTCLWCSVQCHSTRCLFLFTTLDVSSVCLPEYLSVNVFIKATGLNYLSLRYHLNHIDICSLPLFRLSLFVLEFNLIFHWLPWKSTLVWLQPT